MYLSGLFWLLEVAEHHNVATNAQLAGLAAWHNTSLCVDDFLLEVVQLATHCRRAYLYISIYEYILVYT